ncbi:MAG: PAS domain-containing protein, partial [Ardenticatenia bacterium]|nr:PAS domain-containing protein [Ardenticatenia bacterium]
KSGERIPVVFNGSVIREEDGRLAAVVGVARDIRERKRVEAALQRSKREWESTFDAMADWVSLIDPEARILRTNRVGEKFVGVPLAEMVGQTCCQLLHGTEEPIPECPLQKMLHTHQRETVELQVSDGDRWLMITVDPLIEEDGNLIGAVHIVHDITERKRAEEAIQRREAEFRSLAENLPDIAARFDRDLRHIYGNRQVEQVTGIPPKQFLGKTNRELGMPDELVEVWDRELMKAFETSQSSTLEFAFPAPHGLRYSESRIVPECGPDGSVETVLVINRDITERKRALEETAHSQRLLLALSHAAQAVQRARTPDEIYRTVGDAVANLGYHAVVYTLTDDGTHFAISYLTFEPAVMRAAEKLTGLTVEDYRLPLAPGGLFEGIISQGKTTFYEPVAEFIAKVLPKRVSSRLAALLGLGQGIVAPLTVGGETHGLLMVTGTDLTEADVPAVTAFANQAAIALENARLLDQVQRQTTELEQRIAERTRDLATLYEVTAVASESLNLQTTLERSLEQVLEALQCRAGAIQVLDETGERLRLAVHQRIPPDLVAQWDSLPADGGLMGWVLEHKEPLMVPDVVADPRTRQAVRASGFTAYVGAPMRASGQVLGVLSVFGEAGQQFSAEDVALVASVADHVGVAVENARLRRRAEEAAVLEERQRLARELHDSVTQSLYSLTLFAEAARELAVAGDLDRVENYVAQLGETALQALKEMRLLVYQLRPEALERVGLVEALQQRLDAVEGRAGVENHLLVEEGLTLPPPVRQGLYLIAREALNNALKHAAATSVTVHIRTEGQHVKLEVVDNGRGFDPGTLRDRGGMGLISMRERAEALGGSLTVLSAPGEGTRVKVEVPL